MQESKIFGVPLLLILSIIALALLIVVPMYVINIAEQRSLQNIYNKLSVVERVVETPKIVEVTLTPTPTVQPSNVRFVPRTSTPSGVVK